MHDCHLNVYIKGHGGLQAMQRNIIRLVFTKVSKPYLSVILRMNAISINF